MCRVLLPATCPQLVLSQSRGRWDLSPVEGGPRPIKLTVRRDALLEDAYRGLAGLGQAAKGRLMVSGGAWTVTRQSHPCTLHAHNTGSLPAHGLMDGYRPK